MTETKDENRIVWEREHFAIVRKSDRSILSEEHRFCICGIRGSGYWTAAPVMSRSHWWGTPNPIMSIRTEDLIMLDDEIYITTREQLDDITSKSRRRPNLEHLQKGANDEGSRMENRISLTYGAALLLTSVALMVHPDQWGWAMIIIMGIGYYWYKTGKEITTYKKESLQKIDKQVAYEEQSSKAAYELLDALDALKKLRNCNEK